MGGYGTFDGNYSSKRPTFRNTLTKSLFITQPVFLKMLCRCPLQHKFSPFFCSLCFPQLITKLDSFPPSQPAPSHMFWSIRRNTLQFVIWPDFQREVWNVLSGFMQQFPIYHRKKVCNGKELVRKKSPDKMFTSKMKIILISYCCLLPESYFDSFISVPCGPVSLFKFLLIQKYFHETKIWFSNQ